MIIAANNSLSETGFRVLCLQKQDKQKRTIEHKSFLHALMSCQQQRASNPVLFDPELNTLSLSSSEVHLSALDRKQILTAQIRCLTYIRM